MIDTKALLSLVLLWGSLSLPPSNATSGAGQQESGHEAQLTCKPQVSVTTLYGTVVNLI